MARDEAHGGRAVRALGPGSRGRWLVQTVGSQHLFDLDACTYTRLPGAGRGQFPHDGRPVPLTRVERWPTVGMQFLIWFDDPDAPDQLEHWRLSSTVRSISVVEP